MTPSVQERFAPAGRCFGCGTANEAGLRIRSFPAADGDGLVATWTPGSEHLAFEGILNGGVIGTLLDCHSNWTAALGLMEMRGSAAPWVCVTADYAIRLRRPTPVDRPVELRSRVAELAMDRAVVEAELRSGDETTATCRGRFIAVGRNHPAHGRW